MVDQIAARPISTSDPRVATASRVVQPAAATTPVVRTADETPVAAGSLASTLAASPPVDTDRVAMIKAAIANGTFPIAPAQIADQFIALKLAWNSNDAS